jgi:hypothetical protein
MPEIDGSFCEGRADGDCVNPWDNTKYISCVAQSAAYERDLPLGCTSTRRQGRSSARQTRTTGPRSAPDWVALLVLSTAMAP